MPKVQRYIALRNRAAQRIDQLGRDARVRVVCWLVLRRQIPETRCSQIPECVNPSVQRDAGISGSRSDLLLCAPRIRIDAHANFRRYRRCGSRSLDAPRVQSEKYDTTESLFGWRRSAGARRSGGNAGTKGARNEGAVILCCMVCTSPLTADDVLKGRVTCSARCQRKRLSVRKKLRNERICKFCNRSRPESNGDGNSRAFRMSCQR